MVYRFTLLFLFFILKGIHSNGQEIGAWKSHFSYTNIVDLAETPERIYAASSGGLFYIDKEDNSANIVSKIDGLSDNIISKIAYSKETKTTVIVYENTNIDLIKDDKVSNVPDILNKQILGKKYINKIFCTGNLAYLSAGFAIIVLDLKREEIKDTYNLGITGAALEIFQVTTNGNSIFAAAEDGVYESTLDNPFLTNPNQWIKHSSAQNIPSTKIKSIVTFAGKVYGLFGDDVFRFENNTWAKTPFFALGAFLLRVDNSTLSAVTNYGVFVYDENENSLITLQTNDGSYENIKTSLVLANRKVWIGDGSKGLIRFNNPGFENFPVNGPPFNTIGDIISKNRKVLMAPGGRGLNFAPLFNQDGFSILEDGKWSILNKTTNPDLQFFDFETVEIDPINPEIFYVGSFGSGLIKYQDNKLAKVYNISNSALMGALADETSCRVSGLALDLDRNLWACNYLSPTPIVRFKPDGTSNSYTLPGITDFGRTDLIEIMVDAFDQKWFFGAKNDGVGVFNEKIKDGNGKPVARLLDVSTGLIESSNKVRCMVSDLEGAVWIGTDKGLVVYYDPGSILTNRPQGGQQIKIVQNGLVQFLLGSETIISIAVDGANRKWIGTNNGVWLFSEDGQNAIHNFTTLNSPLPGNEVRKIAIDGINGDVYFGTNAGLVSYKSTSTDGGITNSNVLVYPNPVRENFQGTIAIQGLVKDANVKITDVTGNLVFQTVAEGGQAIWNGKDFKNQKVNTGVYLVFASNSDGLETVVSKILFIN